jgi:XTP/dITP diphosphohydrolase
MRLVVATRSQHKMKEIREILVDVEGLKLLSLDEAGVAYSPEEEDLEPFESFEENARSKAIYYRRRAGLPTVAEDSGLEVDALEGRPGVRTKRFAPGDELQGDARDQANNAYLLELMAGRPTEERAARYVCVAALALTPDQVECFRGEAPGRVLKTPRGTSGFGYDPVMLHEESGRSFAELTSQEKNALSHRGTAFRSMVRALHDLRQVGT